MDPDAEVHFDFPPYVCQYKSGRVVRYGGAPTAPPGTDVLTDVTSKDVPIGTDGAVSVRVYLPELASPFERLPVLVYFHGGGFVAGSAAQRSTHAYLNDLAARAPVLAVSVEYRRAPEHPLPAAHDDSWAAVRWVASHAGGAGGTEPWLAEHGDLSRLFLAGCSAGANIAHNVALRAGAGGGVAIKGLVSVHPYFTGKEPVGGEAALGPAMREFFDATWRFVFPGTSGLDDPLVNPFAPGAPSAATLGCERVLVCVAEEDRMLRDRGLWYYEGLKASGFAGEVELFESRGVGHAFHFEALESEQARALQERTVAFIRK